MPAPLKGLLIAFAVCLACSAALLVYARSQRATSTANTASLPILFPIGEFDFETQTGGRVTAQSMKGHVWVANVFFSSCTSICPGVTRSIKSLDAAVRNPEIRIVSFTLDPARDTVDILREYAKSAESSGRWTFARAADQEAIFKFVRTQMKFAVQTTDDPDNILHSGQLLLIDQDGNARGVYEFNDPDAMKELAKDADTLARQ